MSGVPARVAGGVRRWVLPAVAQGRVAWLRTLLGLVVAYNVAFVNNSVGHGSTPQFWAPVSVLRVLGVPPPTVAWLQTLQVFVIALALVTATGRLPRLAGWPLAVAYLLWQAYEMSYGKVDHDEVAMIVGLFVVPTAGRARHRDERTTEAAGYAVRCTEVAVCLTYFLSFLTKIHLVGWRWANGAIFVWALLRRGHPWSDQLLRHPDLLHASQWGVLAMEITSPLLLLASRRLAVYGTLVFLVFHTLTWASIGITFLPTAICLAAFWPLEQVPARWDRYRERRRAGRTTRAGTGAQLPELASRR